MKSLASEKVLSETRERLSNLKVEDRARWGVMTATQMVRHLNHAYDVALGERTIEPIKGAPPALVKWVALRSGLRWPKNLPTAPDLLRALDEAESNAFEGWIKTATEKMEAVASGRRYQREHPMFGPMSASDWMRWGYLHADHHLRQFGR